jgi:hypothetical protein
MPWPLIKNHKGVRIQKVENKIKMKMRRRRKRRSVTLIIIDATIII